MNIVYTLNNKFVPQVTSSIISVLENNKDINIKFYLIQNDITFKNKTIMKNIVYKYNQKIIFIKLNNLSTYLDFKFDTLGWNEIVLARLLIDKLLPKNVEKILYLDGDTIVRGSLKELWEDNMNDKIIGASIEPTYNNKYKSNINLENELYYNAGVLLINLKKWRQFNAGDKIINFYKEHNGNLFANDQDAINGCMHDEIYTISPKYNFYNIFYQYNYKFLLKLVEPKKYISKKEFNEAVSNPIIIHYLGEERPWRIGNTHKYKNDYIKYLNMTPYINCNMENGWQFYFICWKTFNIITKLFPSIRYIIINTLIPFFMRYRANIIKNTNLKNS